MQRTYWHPSVFALVYLMITTPSFAQLPQKVLPAFDDENGTAIQADGSRKIGFFLEGEFSKYFKDCAGEQMKLKDGRLATSIPQTIVGAVPYWDWIRNPIQYSIANAFSVVVDGADLNKTVLPPAITPDNHLPMDALQDPSTTVPPGVSAIAYSANCTAILASALSVDANVSFPWWKLSSLVSADYSNNDGGELGLIAGQFNSPFKTLYSGTVPGDQSANLAAMAHYLLWDWYRQRYKGKASIQDEKLAMLSWFKGYALYKVSHSTRSLDKSLTVKGDTSYLGILTGSGSLDGTYNQYGSASINSYEIAILVPKDLTAQSATSKFDLIDSPSTVAQWLAASSHAVRIQDTAQQVSLRQGVQISHREQIIGLTDNLCQTDWQIEPNQIPNIGKLQLLSKDFHAGDAKNLPNCVFTIGFLPDDALFTGAGTHKATLAYSLTTSIADQKLVIKADKVGYQTSNLPAITSGAAPAAFSSSIQANGTLLTWNFDLQVLSDSNSAIDFSKKPTPMNDFALNSCASLPKALPAVITVKGLEDGGVLHLSVTQFVRSKDVGKPDDPDQATCGISGSLQFVLTTGDLVQLELPTSAALSYPNPPSPPPPAVPVNPIIPGTVAHPGVTQPPNS